MSINCISKCQYQKNGKCNLNIVLNNNIDFKVSECVYVQKNKHK